MPAIASSQKNWLPLILTFTAGVVFALGLNTAGMTDPRKVLAFLDISGDWDPSLAFVMMGAIGFHALAYHFWLKKSPSLSQGFVLPSMRSIDGRLVGGAALFGVGWGIGGFCPGPALVSLLSGAPSVLYFVGAMLLGMWIQGKTAAISTLSGGAKEHGSGSGIL